jgi:hypothetical protein
MNSSDNEYIYELMDSIKLPRFNVTQVGIKVIFKTQQGKSPTPRKFKISYPNWCGLKHEGDDKIIHEMLAASGIEPTKIDIEK